jgi:hypothetical protein
LYEFSSRGAQNLELHKDESTIPTGHEFHGVSNREAQINDCDNIDSGESIDSDDNIDTKSSIFKKIYQTINENGF